MARILIQSPSGGAVEKIAAQALGGGRVVRTTGTDTVDYCDPFDFAQMFTLLGVTVQAVGALEPVTVIMSGEVEGFTGLTPGLPIFCGPNGVITQTEDPAWEWSRIIGHAETANKINVSLWDPIEN